MYEVWIHICIENKRMTNLNLSTKLTDRNDVLLMYGALEAYSWQVSYFVPTIVIDSLVLETNAVCFPVGLDTILLYCVISTAIFQHSCLYMHLLLLKKAY